MFKCGCRDTFTVVNDPFTREIGVVRVTGLSRDKFTTGNIHTQGRKGNEVFHFTST